MAPCALVITWPENFKLHGRPEFSLITKIGAPRACPYVRQSAARAQRRALPNSCSSSRLVVRRADGGIHAIEECCVQKYRCPRLCHSQIFTIDGSAGGSGAQCTAAPGDGPWSSKKRSDIGAAYGKSLHGTGEQIKSLALRKHSAVTIVAARKGEPRPLYRRAHGE